MSRPQIGDLIPLMKKAEPYQRPADWLPLPKLTEGDQKIVGLHAVFPHDSNFCAIEVEGDYTVDWGDGSAPQNYDSGDTAYHIFDYGDLSPDTECSRGYRQAIVTITPQSGQDLTSINFGVMHNQPELIYEYTTGWLDVRIVGESIGWLSFIGYWDIYNRMLEIFEFVGPNVIEDFEDMFSDCYSLQSIPELDTSRGENFSGMFMSCFSLRFAPELNTSGGTNFRWMFVECSSLQSIPELDTSRGAMFDHMFSGCYSLQSIPLLDTSKGEEDFSSMFRGCYSLQSIPLLDTSKGEDFSSMFRGCYSLQSIPELDVSAVDIGGSSDAFNYMFEDCFSLSQGKLLGTSEDISYRNCRLSRQALVDIFDGLADLTGKTAQTIDIRGNWGISDLTQADRNIALNKNWTITG